MRGNSSCVHSMELHMNVVHTFNNNAVLTLRPNQSHQCPIALNGFNSHNSNQGRPLPNNCDFLQIIDGDASETRA